MDLMMTKQSAQIGRLVGVIDGKEERKLLEGTLLKKENKGLKRKHKRYCRLTTKHLVYWKNDKVRCFLLSYVLPVC